LAIIEQQFLITFEASSLSGVGSRLTMG